MSRTLYPLTPARETLRVAVGDGHELHVEDCGNPDGLPVVFLHGGPGSGSKPGHRQYFDPARWRPVLFDQRGCNRSSPRGQTAGNDTWKLVADMERIRGQLGIERWVLFGGSWGAALALAYAQKHPDRVSAMVLRGTFLGRPEDVNWFFAPGGVSRVFPDAWAEFIEALQAPPGADLVPWCHEVMHGDDPAAQARVARAWARWSGRVVMYAMPPPAGNGSADGNGDGGFDVEQAIAEVRIETHYARHGYFLEPDQLLRDLDRIPPVPVRIIHGRRDMT